MKKRTLAIFLGLLLVFCLSSCACQHEWKEATCTEPKTCTKCGETEGEALGQKQPAQKRRSAAAAEKRVENLWDMT